MVPREEVALWAEMADAVEGGNCDVTEQSVIPEVDPSEDLARRGRKWMYRFETHRLTELFLFAGGLAQVEADAWSVRDAVTATQALDDRRHFLADRLMPWATPLLIQRGGGIMDDVLLRVGDRHRLLPLGSSAEGLVPPGHDGYGPLDQPADAASRQRSLWGGLIPPVDGVHPVEEYLEAAEGLASVGDEYPGTAAMWADLEARCAVTARLLSA